MPIYLVSTYLMTYVDGINNQQWMEVGDLLVNLLECIWYIYCTVMFTKYKDGALQDCNNLFWGMLIIAFFTVINICIMVCMCCTACVFLCLIVGLLFGAAQEANANQ